MHRSSESVAAIANGSGESPERTVQSREGDGGIGHQQCSDKLCGRIVGDRDARAPVLTAVLTSNDGSHDQPVIVSAQSATRLDAI
jgi:hypothetical protein